MTNDSSPTGDPPKGSFVVKLALYSSALILMLMGGALAAGGWTGNFQRDDGPVNPGLVAVGAVLLLGGAALFLRAGRLHDLLEGTGSALPELTAGPGQEISRETVPTPRGVFQRTIVRDRSTAAVDRYCRFDERGLLVLGGDPPDPFVAKLAVGLGVLAAALAGLGYRFEEGAEALYAFAGVFGVGFVVLSVGYGLYEKIEMDKRQGEIRTDRRFFGRFRSTATFRIAEFDAVLVRRVVTQTKDRDRGSWSTSVNYPIVLVGKKELRLTSYEHPVDAQGLADKVGSYLELPTRTDFEGP
jgi:hypothetical protein